VKEYIDVDGHPLWKPIPLDVTPEELGDSLRREYTGTAPDVELETNVAAMVAVSRQLRTPDAEDGMNLAAWALVEDPGTLSVRDFAALRVAELDAATTTKDAVAGLTEGHSLFQEPVVEALETASGEAVAVRFRPMVQEEGEVRVHQVTAVLWLRPEHLALFMLSTYAEDLVAGAETADRLMDLAAGVRGLTP
jgi:hypothetical protein